MLFVKIKIMQYLKFYYNGINDKIHIHSSLLCSLPVECNFVNRFTPDAKVVSNGEKKSL